MEEIRETVFFAVDDADIDRNLVRFVYLFGSYSEDVATASDVDICISVDGDNPSKLGYRIQGRLPDDFDLSVFEELPLHVKMDVFNGELVYARDDSVYDVAYEVFRDYESFEPLYKTAIGA